MGSRGAIDMVDGLGVRTLVLRAEDDLQRHVPERQEVIRTGQPHDAGQVPTRIQPNLAKPATIEGEHRRVVGACRMSDQEQTARITPPIGGMTLCEGHSQGVVLQECRVADLRIDPIVRNDGDDPAGRQ